LQQGEQNTMASLLIHQQPKEDARIYSGKLEKKVFNHTE